MLKSNMSDIYSHKYMKIKINSDDDLPLEKSLNIRQDHLKNALIVTIGTFYIKGLIFNHLSVMGAVMF